jgi:predicted MFS family arabinose efflux permease
MIDTGNGLGSVALGILAGKMGYASIYTCSSIIMGIFLISYIFFMFNEKHNLPCDPQVVEAKE